MLQHSILLTIILAGGQTLAAKSLSFQDYGFSIELPPTWHAVDPPPANSICSIQTADGLKGLVVTASSFPKNKLPTALLEMVNGAKNAAKAKGCEIQNEHQLTINGVPMHAYTTQIADTVSIASYMGFADDVGFSLQGYSKTSDAGADAEITTVLNSFRVLSKTESRPKVAQPDDTAFRFGYVVGCVATLLFVLGLFWMIISKSKRNKNPV